MVEQKLGTKLTRVPMELLRPAPRSTGRPTSAFTSKSRTGLNWIGVLLPVGKMTSAQMRAVAKIATKFGDGEIRLTVWQNFLISGVPDAKVAAAVAAIEALGLAAQASAIRSGLIACTGNTGCRFAASDTKRHAQEIAEWCESRVALDARSTFI